LLPFLNTTLTHLAGAMSSNSFNPDTDIPSLAGKVIFITGGEF
jgi:hypothetical protein